MDNNTKPRNKGFTVTHLNTRSVRNKIDEICVLLTKHKIDVLTISESWLTSSISDSVININNYSAYRQDRLYLESTNKKGGGLLTYVNHAYLVDEFVHSHLNQCNSDIELQVLEIKKHLNKGTIIINTYRPPSGGQATFLQIITDTLSQLENTRYSDIYVIGDFNLDHSVNKRNDITKNLIQSFKSFGFQQYVNQTTRKTAKTNSIIDVIYIKTDKNIDIFIDKTVLSDHYLVGSTRYLGYARPQTININGRSYKNYSFDLAMIPSDGTLFFLTLILT